MREYKLSPFALFVESDLFATATQYAVFNRLTGQFIESEPAVQTLLQSARTGNPFSLELESLSQLGETGRQIWRLLEAELLIPEDYDPLASFLDYYVNRPLQNPALTYRDESGAVSVVRLSMTERVYSPERGKLPPIVEESLPQLATDILFAADGTRTLRQIYAKLEREGGSILEDREFRDAIELLSTPERQLIKFAPSAEGFANPFFPANLVPRNLYHASKWNERNGKRSIADFHIEGIEDALWEFDIIEPTVNHGLRFPNELLAGLDYGARFCDAVFALDVFHQPSTGSSLQTLEVGGGTGSFARSFIKRAQSKVGTISHQIVDLSPALIENQRQVLRDVQPPVRHIAQDAINLDLPDREFDLIVTNEVIADFPVAAVERHPSGDSTAQFTGAGTTYIEKYSLSVDDAPDRFYVNAGVFQFLERAWLHLRAGGALVMSEYGSESRYPAESFHLNHSEYTIHFGHVAHCARKIGFECRLQTLIEFLRIDDHEPVLNGRDEHILCLNHVFTKYGEQLPFALWSEKDFKASYGNLARRLGVEPIRFLPLHSNFYFGPNLCDFFVLILRKPFSQTGNLLLSSP